MKDLLLLNNIWIVDLSISHPNISKTAVINHFENVLILVRTVIMRKTNSNTKLSLTIVLRLNLSSSHCNFDNSTCSRRYITKSCTLVYIKSLLICSVMQHQTAKLISYENSARDWRTMHKYHGAAKEIALWPRAEHFDIYSALFVLWLQLDYINSCDLSHCDLVTPYNGIRPGSTMTHGTVC